MSEYTKFKVLTVDEPAYIKLQLLCEDEKSTLTYFCNHLIKEARFKDLIAKNFDKEWVPYRRIAMNLTDDNCTIIKMLAKAMTEKRKRRTSQNRVFAQLINNLKK